MPKQVSSPTDRLAIAATAPQATQPSSPTASLPIAPTVAQPAKEAPAGLATVGGASEPAPTVRGITDSEIRFGISAPFTGPAKELGQNMKLGIETAFKVANANGGVYGRQLRLMAADDGYEPARTAATMIGLGTPITFSRSDHQGVHKVWGTQLDETGHYQPIDLL